VNPSAPPVTSERERTVDGTELATLIVSVLTAAAGVVTIWRALRRRRLSLASGKDPLRPHRFTKRRVTMGVLMLVVAFMLFAGVFLLERYFGTRPWAFTWFWLAVIGLLLWLTGLALWDLTQVMFSAYASFGAGKPRSKRRGKPDK
jgi:heme/copper-type cytochrome/quinol oxidase subunit 1